MSYQHGGQCFGFLAEAWASLAAAEVGSIRAAGSAVYVVDVSGVSTSGIDYVLTDMVTGSTVAYTATPAMQPCALLDWQDGLELGWGIGSVWIAAAAILFLARSRKGG